VTTSFYIGGKWLPAQSDAVFDVVSPGSEERIGSVPAASPAGIGREDGVDGLREYLQPKTISVDPAGELPAEILAATVRTRWEA
jgi:acyl-CoA reductase-like NAD-dependent aldehyde dehydrogenase